MKEKRLTQLLGTIHTNDFIPSDMTHEEQNYCMSKELIIVLGTSSSVAHHLRHHSRNELPTNLTTAVLTPKGMARLKALRSSNI